MDAQPTASPQQKRQIIEQVFAAYSAGRVDDYLAWLTEDVIEEYPQSGERFVGRATLREIAEAYPGYPTFSIKRIQFGADLAIVEGSADYGSEGGGVFMTVFIYEFRGDRIAHETAYWPQPFPAAEWRARWNSGPSG